MINQILEERYEIQKELGSNPGRKTVLAKDLETQELVVIKILHFNGEIKWQDFKLFEREAQILQQLSHPAIPNYLNSFDLDLPDIEGFALVQTYIPATSLEEHIRLGRNFNEAEVKQIAKSLLEVLDYLYNGQYPVIHRDIKPNNILLENRSGNHVGDVYLVDFGAVKTKAQNQSGTMTVVGTYGYMAQEHFGGRAVSASDLYSLGATLIYLVTGNHPSDLLNDDMVIEFDKSVNLSSDFVNWLKWMTQTTIKNRPSSAEVALKELENPTIPESKIVSNKPVNSRIKLIQEKDKLEVITPPNGLSIPHTFLAITLFFPSLFIIYWSIYILIFFINEDVYVRTLFFTLFGSLLGLILNKWRKTIFTIWGYTCISINKKNIQIKYRVFDLNFFTSQPISNSDIYKLELIDENIYDKDKQQGKDLARLTIYSNVGSYELKNIPPVRKGFSELKVQPPIFTLPEIYWLAKELSDYFGLPVLRNITSIESDSF